MSNDVLATSRHRVGPETAIVGLFTVGCVPCVDAQRGVLLQWLGMNHAMTHCLSLAATGSVYRSSHHRQSPLKLHSRSLA